MKTLVEIKQQTNNKFVNLFTAHYKLENGKDFVYEFVSRKPLEKLTLKTKITQPDAVRMLPYFFNNGQLFVVLIKEFRHAIGKHIYSTPAGLIDDEEDEKLSVARELEEEIGATSIKIEKVELASFSSVGLSDESSTIYEVEVNLNKQQQLFEHEDIKIKIVSLDEIPNILEKEEFSMQARLHLRGFYYKQKYLQLLSKIK